jgi:hypothetical protein
LVDTRRVAKAIALALLPSALLGQTVRGVVAERSSRQAVVGAIVQLIDSAGRPASQSLSNERGEYRVSVGVPGVYRLRTLRIGFRPQTSDALTLAADETVERSLVISSLPVSLDTVRVATRNSCRASGDTVVATYTVWEQVRAALAAAQMTAASAELAVNVMSYERTLDPTFKGVRKQSASFGNALSVRPWQSASAEEFRRRGYVTDDASGSRTYLAPDLEALLSPEFIEDHCIRLSTGSAATLIGIEFEPNRDRAKIPEIRGTVWVDRASAEVRSMDFRYENLTVAEIEARPGGQMEFLRFKDGGWVISRWNIRMPVVTLGAEFSGVGSLFRRDVQRVNEIRVAGGEVISVMKGAQTVYERPPIAISGEVIDSTSRERLAGARVTVRGTSLAGTTDRNGLFTIANVLPGDYALDVRTTSLDSLNGSYSIPVTVTDPPSRIRINVPSADDYAREFCPSATDSTKASGYVIGSVRLAGDTNPPWNVAVTASWADGKDTRSISSRTDANGRYRMCGVPVARELQFRSELDDTAAAPKRLRIPGRKRFAVVEFTIARPAVATGSLFAGTVAAEWSRQPLADAEVTIPSLNLSVRTNSEGRFRLAGVPIGSHRVSARKVGYAATEMDVSFAGTAPVVRQFLLGGVATLDPVAVTARPMIPDFEEHRRLGLGKFLTREQLAKLENLKMSAILAELSSVDMVQGRGDHAFPRSNRMLRVFDTLLYKTLGLGGVNRDNMWCPTTYMEAMQGAKCNCYAQVYLDRMLLNPGRPTEPLDVNTFAAFQLEGVEWYPGDASLPLEYARRGATCGVLILHTRRGKL